MHCCLCPVVFLIRLRQRRNAITSSATVHRVIIMDDCDELFPGWLKFLLGVIQCFLNRCSDAAGESTLDIAISLFQLGIPHSPVWYSCVSRRYFSLGAASLFAATFCCVRQPALHSRSFTDNSLEFGKACEDLSWNHCTSTHTDQKLMELPKDQCAW